MYFTFRHGLKLFICAFFIFWCTLAAAYSQTGKDAIPFAPDPVGQSTYYFNQQNPFLFSDFKFDAVRIDGGWGTPLGSYLINPFPARAAGDSIPMRTFFDYFQGDYSYRELTVGVETETQSKGKLQFLGLGRSFNGIYNNLGPQNSTKDNVLQNYLLTYSKSSDNWNISIGTLYHLENVGLPIFNNSYINRSVESYHFGGDLSINTINHEFSLSTAFQFGEFFIDTTGFESFTGWNIAKWKYQIASDKLYLYFSNSFKNNTVECNFHPDQYEHIILNRIGAEFVNSNSHYQLGVAFTHNSITPEGEYFRKWGDLEFAIIRNYGHYLSIDDSIFITDQDYVSNKIKIDYHWKNINFSFEPALLEWQNDHFGMINGAISYDLNWLNFSVSGIYIHSDSVIFDQNIAAAILFSPVIKNKRYRPFVKISSLYYHFPDLNTVDLRKITGKSSSYGLDYETQILDIAFGFEVKNFKFTYKSQNILNQQIEYSTPDKLLPLERINYFEVLWIFND